VLWSRSVPESRLRVLSWTSQWHPLNLPPGCLMTLSNCRIQFVSCPQTAGSGSGIGLRTRDPPGSDTGITKGYSLPSEQYHPSTDAPRHNHHYSKSQNSTYYLHSAMFANPTRSHELYSHRMPTSGVYALKTTRTTLQDTHWHCYGSHTDNVKMNNDRTHSRNNGNFQLNNYSFTIH
jgi:hypothetical protein